MKKVIFILFVALTTISAMAQRTDPLFGSWDIQIQQQMQDWRASTFDGQAYHFDNVLQYAPAAAVFGLKVVGVESQHDYWETTKLMAASYVVAGTIVLATKYSVKLLRPDGRSYNSFPSGHTATAFCGAEILRHEYKNQSPAIPVMGYAAATLVGTMRIYNNRHWFSDVLAGAGIGVLSANAAYWMEPWLCPSTKTRPVESTQLIYYSE